MFPVAAFSFAAFLVVKGAISNRGGMVLRSEAISSFEALIGIALMASLIAIPIGGSTRAVRVSTLIVARAVPVSTLIAARAVPVPTLIVVRAVPVSTLIATRAVRVPTLIVVRGVRVPTLIVVRAAYP